MSIPCVSALPAGASFAVLLCVAQTGWAQFLPAGIEWKCRQQFDERYEVLCIPVPAEPAPDSRPAFSPVAAITAPADLPAPDDRAGSGAAPRRGRDLRPVARRGTREAFSRDYWQVPLFTRPSDPAAVLRLLQAVLCGDAPSCSVSYNAR